MAIGGDHPVGVFGLEIIATGDKVPTLEQAGHIKHSLGSKPVMLFLVLHVTGGAVFEQGWHPGTHVKQTN